MADPSQTTHLKFCPNDVGMWDVPLFYFAAQEKKNEYILLDTDHILHNRHTCIHIYDYICIIMYIFISNHISTRMNFKIFTYPLVMTNIAIEAMAESSHSGYLPSCKMVDLFIVFCYPLVI